MTVQVYWISESVVIDWTLTLPDGQTPITDATVALVVTKPDGTDTAPVAAIHIGEGLYRAIYSPTEAGLHAFELTATGTGDDTEKGNFYVKADPAVSPPATLDPTTAVGQVRLLVSDLDEDNLIFHDTEIQAFLTLEGDSIRLAAAQALDTLASNEAMVAKKIRTQDLTTDGPAVAKELRERAAALRQQVDDGAEADSGGFDIVNFDPTYGLFTTGI